MTTGDGTDALLDAAVAGIDYPDPDAAHAVLRHRLAEGMPAGTLGVLEELSVWAAGVQGSDRPRPFDRTRLVCFSGTPGPLVRTLADAAGVGVVAMPAGSASTETALAAGIAAADREVDEGAELLIAVELAGAGPVPAATLISVLTDTEPVKVVGRPPGTDDAGWITHCAAIRDRRRLAWPHRTEPLELLAAAGDPELAALTGFLLQAANRRTPVLLDGVPAAAAATVAQVACPRVVRWLQAGQLSPDPAHGLALQRLGLTPILRLDSWHGGGVGALLALPVLRAAVLSLQPEADTG
jgi:nicotinate-nucleotide--dimethylbenzimidazole phosphoribosyltransferase